MQLNNIYVGSEPAQLALTAQLKSDKRHYEEMFSRFINIATSDDDMKKLAMEYAIGTFAGDADAYSTLVNINPLEDKLGALIQNATIFAIAATCTNYLKGTKISPGIAMSAKTQTGETPFMPSKGWVEYSEDMKINHEGASWIVNHMVLGLTPRRKYKNNILAVMGYLIEQSELTVEQQSQRITKTI